MSRDEARRLIGAGYTAADCIRLANRASTLDERQQWMKSAEMIGGFSASMKAARARQRRHAERQAAQLDLVRAMEG